MKRGIVISNIKYIFKNSIKIICSFLAVIGFVGLFVPFSDYIADSKSIWVKMLIAFLILALIWGLAFGICVVGICVKKQYKLFDVNNGHAVYVQYGDVFSEKEIKTANKKRNIIIPVNRCFDTIVDDDLISSNTVHGKCLKKVYERGSYTQESLNSYIQDFLKAKNLPFEDIDSKTKRSGNLKRYEVGTVAEVKDAEVTYFFLGLSEFDKDLHAHTSDEQYILAVMRMLKYNNCRSMGYPLILPLIGAGAADTKKDEQDILEYLVKALKLNKGLINSDVHIVVRSSAKSRVAITDL